MWGGNMGGKTTDHWLDGYLGTYAGEESKWVSLDEDRLVVPLEKEGVAGICLLRLADGCIVSRDAPRRV